MSFRALKTFVELKIFYFVDPIDSIQYMEISYFLHVSYGRTKYGTGYIDGAMLSKLANNYFDSLQSDPCHRFDYDSIHQSMKGRHQKTQTISVIQYINTHYSIRQVPVTLEKWYRWSQSKQKNLEDKYLEPWRQYQAIVNPRQRSY